MGCCERNSLNDVVGELAVWIGVSKNVRLLCEEFLLLRTLKSNHAESVCSSFG